MLRYPTDDELAVLIERILATVREAIAEAPIAVLVSGLSDEVWIKLKADEDDLRASRRSGMTLEEQETIKKGTRVRLRARARRSLGRGERITPEMADAVFYDEAKGQPLKLTRAEQAMLIVFGKVFDG